MASLRDRGSIHAFLRGARVHENIEHASLEMRTHQLIDVSASTEDGMAQTAGIGSGDGPGDLAIANGASLRILSLPSAVLERVVSFLDGGGNLLALLLSCKTLSWPAVRKLWASPPTHNAPALKHLAFCLRQPEGRVNPPNAPYFDYAAYITHLDFARRFMEKEHAWIFNHIIRCCGRNLRSLVIRHPIARRLRAQGYEIAFLCPSLASLTLHWEDVSNENLIPDKLPNLRNLYLQSVDSATKALLVHVCRMYYQELHAFSFNCQGFPDVAEDMTLSHDEIRLIASSLSSVSKLTLLLPDAEDVNERFYWRVTLFEILRFAQYEGLCLVDSTTDYESLEYIAADIENEPEMMRVEDIESFDYRRLQDPPAGVVTPHALRACYSMSGPKLRTLTIESDGLSAMALRGLSSGCPNITKLRLRTHTVDEWILPFVEEIAQLRYLRDLALDGFPETEAEVFATLLETLPFGLTALDLRTPDAPLSKTSPIVIAIKDHHASTLEILSAYADFDARGMGSFLRLLGKNVVKSRECTPHLYEPDRMVPIHTSLQKVVFDFQHEEGRCDLPPWMRNISYVQPARNVSDDYQMIIFCGELLRRAMFCSSLEAMGDKCLEKMRDDDRRLRERERLEKEAKLRASKDEKSGKNKGAAPTPPPSDDDEEEDFDEDEDEWRSINTDDLDDAEKEEDVADGPSVELDSEGREIMEETDEEEPAASEAAEEEASDDGQEVQDYSDDMVEGSDRDQMTEEEDNEGYAEDVGSCEEDLAHKTKKRRTNGD